MALRVGPPPPTTSAAGRALTRVYRALVLCVVLLVLLLAAGTIYALLFRDADAAPLYRVSGAAPVEPAVAGELSPQPPSAPIIPTGESIFTGIGRLRAISADKPAVTIVVSIVFPYEPSDQALSEELTAKVPDFRNVVLEYFSTHRAADLRNASEDNIKADLLRRFNILLRLGSIHALYFNDFMFID
jgi:flagellar basal body-associated protein FliL